MDIRKKLLSIVGVLALTMSMTAGIAMAAEEIETTGSQDLTVGFGCWSDGRNGTLSSLALNSGSSDPVSLGTFDPSAPALVATTANVFLVELNIGQCATTNWTVTASISDFATDPDLGPVETIGGTHFQLPFDATSSWMINGTTPETRVTSPTGLVTFGSDTSTSPHAGSANLATATARVSGPMHLEFGAQMFGLTADEKDGVYSATLTVTFGVNP